jgi:hypothetical protein
MEKGYVRSYRSILDHEVFRDPRKLQVWIYILHSASHQDFVKKKGVMLERGQLTLNQRTLGEFLEIPKTTVHRILRWLEDRNMIVTKPERNYTLISVVNWDTCQEQEKEVERKWNASGTQVDHLQALSIKKDQKQGVPTREEVISYAVAQGCNGFPKVDLFLSHCEDKKWKGKGEGKGGKPLAWKTAFTRQWKAEALETKPKPHREYCDLTREI